MTHPARAFGAVIALIGALMAFSPATAALTFPTLTDRVVDDAHVLSPQTQADLTNKLAALEQKNGDQLVVVTVPTLQGQEIEDYGYQLGRAWGLGAKGKNNGAILLVAPSEHKVRIEVGYGLEPVITDALSSVIIQTAILPKFRSGDIDGGVTAGADALVQQLGLDPTTAAANAQAAEQAQVQAPASSHLRIPFFLIILVVFFIVRILLSGGRGGGGLWALPFLFMGGGGGGSFGGGGSSGSW